jgi:hypothetical protein
MQDCHRPFLFGKAPELVRVDPTVDFHGDYRAPYNQYSIRWTGNILIESTGEYEFEINSDDGSWLAVDQRLVITNHGCFGTGGPRKKNGKVFLEKGPHPISILYINQGPADNFPAGTEGKKGTCELRYSGPDTVDSLVEGAQMILVPQKALGSAPMRLSKIEGQIDEAEDVGAVVPGRFIFDSTIGLGVMPVGSCDLQCRRGQRKDGAAMFHFFCSAPTAVSFRADVSQGVDFAMTWIDDEPQVLWKLSDATSLVETNATSCSTENAELALTLGLQSCQAQHFDLRPSLESTTYHVLTGEHRLYFQGRPDVSEAFAMQRMSFAKGLDTCKFFLEGKDKVVEDCRS